MEEAFSYVIWGVVVVGVVAALASLLTSGEAYRQIGRGGLSIGDEEQAAGKRPGGSAPSGWLPTGVTPAASAKEAAEREAEIRQMLEAKNARRRARGESQFDVDEEYHRLMQPPVPAVDAALVEEIRELVKMRNRRLAREGKPTLDVEEEVARRVAELG